MPGGTSVHRPHRGRQPVAVGRRSQQAPTEAQRELLSSLGEGAGVEAPEGVLVGDITGSQDDPETPFLDSFQFQSVALS